MQEQDLRRRLKALADAGAQAASVPPPEEIHRRGVRRYRRGAAIIAAGAVIVTATAGTGSARLLPRDRARTTGAPSGVAATVQRAVPEPAVLFGGIGGGHEREAVISVASGKVLRFLSPPPGSQLLGRLSTDRRTYYEQERDSQCGGVWRAIDVASGRISKGLGGERDVLDFAFSPDGRQLALIKGRPRGPQGTGCAWELVVRDRGAGGERRWPMSGQGRIDSLHWSLDSTRLAYRTVTLPSDGSDGRPSQGMRRADAKSAAQRQGEMLHVVAVAGLHAVGDGVAIRASHAGCVLLPYDAQFRAGGRLLVAEECSAGAARSVALLEYDQVTGRRVATLARVQGNLMVTSLSVDASGQHVLVLLFPDNATEPTAYALRGGRLVPVFRGAYSVAW